MTAELVRGQNHPLPDTRLEIRVSAGHPVLAGATLGDEQGRVPGSEWIAHPGSPSLPGVDVPGQAAADHRLTVDLEAVPGAVHRVSVLLALPGARAGGAARFGAVAAPFVTVAGPDGAEIASYTITGLDSESAVVALELYRRQGAWKVRAMGQGYDGGLAALLADQGLERPAELAASILETVAPGPVPVAAPPQHAPEAERVRHPAPVSAQEPAPTAPTTPPPAGTKADNPYAGAKVYVNPEWSAKAAAEPGGTRISGQPTGVWLDRIAAINGSATSMGLRAHLDEALKQKGSGELVVQLVVYNLPGRDCAALASNGELGPTEIGRYKTEYIDPIAAILGDSKYAGLRIVTTVEIDSLPNLVTNVSGRPTATPNCDVMKANGNYITGVGYALKKLGSIGNVYNYVDAGHHGWLGWDDNFGASAELFKQAATAEGSTVSNVHGFIVNTANYSALKENNFKIEDSVNGVSVRQSKWVDWNRYTDELSYAQAMRTKLVSLGFDSNLGMLIDTSRNGWGGTQRPTGPGALTNVDTYVNGGKYDRRIHLGNWCNQSGAGLGERPTAAPAAGIDAYVWMKPPGESDGASKEIPNNEGKGFDRMCDPTYTGNARNGNSMSGALPDAPISGQWFSAQFQELMKNAYPAL
uniref:glycoside hydrolase family 6 protein n=1 Tax=Streptomyces sp. MSC1_001 TaxID=2909263 RepID=UPI0025481E7E|nr:glycoside hydrolase family 6 protein [Streptomyces sp. MSC1_001]